MSYIQKKICTIIDDEKEFKLYHKVRDYCHYTGKYRGADHSICNLQYKIPKEIRIVFHNGSVYDYHFIIKQLAEEFKGGFKCLGQNTEKYLTFPVPIKKELDNSKKSTYKQKFIDSYRLMSASLSCLVDNLSEVNNKKPENEVTDSMRSMSALLSTHIDDLSEIDKKEPENEFIESLRSMSALISSLIDDISEINKKVLLTELIEKSPITYKFCNKDLNKCELLLRKGVYPYEYMDSWGKFNEKSLPPK